MSELKRFYVGNLFSDVNENDLRSLFERFGSVSNIDVKAKRDIDGNVTATFAFITMEGLGESEAANVIKQCNHLNWKRQIIRVQLAQESFMQRLQRERQGAAVGGGSDTKAIPQPTVDPHSHVRPSIVDKSNYDPLSWVRDRVSVNQAEHRKRYYSSSDEEDDDNDNQANNKKATASGGSNNFLSKLETFNADFWNDCEGPGQKKRPNDKKSFYVEDSNARRLASMKQRQQQLHDEKQRIKAGLGSKKSSMIKFEPEEEAVEKESKKLFQDSDEDDEDADRFRVRPQFEGSSGGKLLSLQSSYRNDERFKLTEKFATEEKKKKQRTFENKAEDVDAEIKEERLRNLKILSSIMGKDMTSDEKAESKKLFKDTSQLRFDPKSGDHSKFLLKHHKQHSSSDEESEEDEKLSDKKTKVPQNESTISSSKPGANGDTNYWVSSSLSTALGGKTVKPSESFSFKFSEKNESTTSGFSLLKQFGRSQFIDDEKSGPASKPGSRHLSFLEQNPFKYDSSDSEDDDNKSSKKSTADLASMDPMELFAMKLREKASASKADIESFFFTRNDPRLNEGKLFLVQKTSMEEVRSQHEEHRPVLAQILKKKLRRRAKKQEKLSFDLKGVDKRRKHGGGGRVMKKNNFSHQVRGNRVK